MQDEIILMLNEIKANTLLAAKNVLTIEDVALLTGLSKSYLYSLTSKKQIPHYKPNGKLMFFDRKEVEEWMLQNRVNTTDEAQQSTLAKHLKSRVK
ncbi:MAG: helix-turn-helix domain-containing protein [Bacteroidales bacterium]|nr:helix-turn-helix domain-containing protein [Bacteroidales bacterium]